MGAPDAGWPPDVEFVDFVSSRQHALLRAAYLVCGDLAIAEGVLRGALVRLAREWDRVRDERPDTAVRRVLYRDAVASWRRRRPAGEGTAPAEVTAPGEVTATPGSEDTRRPEPDWTEPEWVEPEWVEPEWQEPGWAVPSRSPEEEPDEVERRRAVLRALDTLAPRQRAVVVLRFFEDRSESDTADILGVSVSRVHSLADEAVSLVRDALLLHADLEIGGAR